MHLRDIRKIKNDLRSQFKAYRNELDANDKQMFDNAILGRVLSLRQYKSAPLVLTYVSTPIEVDTIELIKHSLALGKRVAVPKCRPQELAMDFYLITSVDDLQPGCFGVLEPDANKCRKLESYEGSICIVPGLGFDTNGFRIGYGKGYYDRFLSNYNGAVVGICYYNCVKWSLPHGRFDRRVDLLVTERYLRRTASKKN